MKKILCFCLILSVFGSFGSQVFANSIADLKKQQQEIKTNTAEAKKKLDSMGQQKSELQQQMDEIDNQLSQVTNELDTVQNELENTQTQLVNTEKELEAAEEDREEQYELLRERLRFMYVNGRIGYVNVLFKTDSFPDFFNRLEYINRIYKYDQGLLNQLKETEQVIADKYNEIDERKKELGVLMNSQKSKQRALEEALGQKKQVIQSLNADEQKYLQQIKELEASGSKVENLIKEKQAEAARAAAAAAAAARQKNAASSGTPSKGTYTGGKLNWPVQGRTGVSSGYGSRKSPISGRSEFHSGIDIPAPTGTNILSAEKGTVIFAGNMNGYGNTVIVDHGNGLSTLYAHNSKLTVSKGQSVDRASVIAKAGSTGYSTGPHLHFEVRVNGAHTNPNNYVR